MALSLEDIDRRLQAHVPDVARNWQMIVDDTNDLLPRETRRGLVLACAQSLRSRSLTTALQAAGENWAAATTRMDALTTAALMTMNNVFYRFRHELPQPAYTTTPARLRMTGMLQPAGTRADVELWATALSALNACGACARAHEAKARPLGWDETQILEAVRIAAVVASVCVVLSAGEAD
ncbi:MAG: carboxymuconolactone decarboxylase family protein [Candidatus Sericytochromatia bacterium]|nr:carboxymuconolactone decarboxylase family protein [Candidatus Tanganyikabacteria bacterium]